jgi:hypothetical protein
LADVFKKATNEAIQNQQEEDNQGYWGESTLTWRVFRQDWRFLPVAVRSTVCVFV